MVPWWESFRDPQGSSAFGLLFAALNTAWRGTKLVMMMAIVGIVVLLALLRAGRDGRLIVSQGVHYWIALIILALIFAMIAVLAFRFARWMKS